jgi:hypothetical protein
LQKTLPLVETFTLLGEFLRQFPEHSRSDSPGIASLNTQFYDSFLSNIDQEHVYNPWFTSEWVELAISGIASMLQRDVLNKWFDAYPKLHSQSGRELTVGLVLAGNIPLVGFHDILCVLASGHRIIAKRSSKDERLITKVAEIISAIDPLLGGRINFTDGPLSKPDAVIATGSNNSARYFDYYFRNIPHIIRKNRNGVAVITGKESEEELEGIGRDIFTYFGLGCRNVTKIYIPMEYDLKVLFAVLDRFHLLGQHHKYSNNVDYHRSIYLLNQEVFLDNGVLLIKEDKAIASPVGVVYFEKYSEIGEVAQLLIEREGEIQCTVSVSKNIPGGLLPGTSQIPTPWDYADGVDTIKFLTEL